MEPFKSKDGYVPLLVNLEGYWEKNLDQLPTELKTVIFDAAMFPNEWDEWDVGQRRWWAAQKDYGNDPSREPALYFELYSFAEELSGWSEEAEKAGKDAAVVALHKIEKRIQEILAVDRERLGAEIQDLRTLRAEPPSVGRWPWGRHETSLLKHMATAGERFWSRYDPDDNTTAPTNEQVSGWLKDNGVAKRTAEVMASILRPDGLPTGPRR